MFKDNIKSYGERNVFRGAVIIACVLCAIILGINHTSIFHSHYDSFMKREIFAEYEGWTITSEDDNVGIFWKYMNFFIVLGYVVTPFILFFNISNARKKTVSAAVTDLIAYGFLALSIPVDLAVCMIGSRSYIVDLVSFIFVFEVLAFALFVSAFVCCILSCIKTRGSFNPGNNTALRIVIVVMLLLLPCLNLAKAIKLSADYAPNYGLFKVDSTGYDPIVDSMLFNYDNGGIEYEGALYICSKLGIDEGYSIDKLDAQGNLVHVTDIDSSARHFRYDVYNGKIYYMTEVEEELLIYYEILSKDIETGEIEVLYRGSSVDMGRVDMFRVKDGFLYYHVSGDRDHSIYCFDLDNSPSERQLFVSDIRYMFDRDELMCAFLYNYLKEPGGTHAPYVYADDIRYTVDIDVADDADAGFPVMTTLYASSQEVFSSAHIDGFTYSDGYYFFYNEASGDMIRYATDTEEVQVIANVEVTDPGSYHTLYIFGDHLLLKSKEMSAVIDI